MLYWKKKNLSDCLCVSILRCARRNDSQWVSVCGFWDHMDAGGGGPVWLSWPSNLWPLSLWPDNLLSHWWTTRQPGRENVKVHRRSPDIFHVSSQTVDEWTTQSQSQIYLMHFSIFFFFFLTIQSLLRVVFHRATLFTHQRTPISGSSSSAGNPLGIKADFFSPPLTFKLWNNVIL